MTDEDFPSLTELLTIVVTTSPIKSNPSTELLERTFETFHLGGREFTECFKVIVCDGVRVIDHDNNTTPNGVNIVTKKHATVKQALRNGIASVEQAEDYKEFKRRLKKLCLEAPAESPFWNAEVEELDERHGYGFALRHALLHCVKTPFVCVIQHDRTFMRPTPVLQALHAMWRHPKKIKYIGMNMRSNLTYRDIFLSKYGKEASLELEQLILRPAELLVDAQDFGPDSDSIKKMVIPSEKLRRNFESVCETYRSSIQCISEQEWLDNNAVPTGKHQMSLTPTVFWYDNTHIAETAHYRDFIFDPSLKMVARGGFVEDKTSPVINQTVESLGLIEGHARFGSFLLDDHSGLFFTGHLDGGDYIPEAERKRLFYLNRQSSST
jgi:hypothetical protein